MRHKQKWGGAHWPGGYIPVTSTSTALCVPTFAAIFNVALGTEKTWALTHSFLGFNPAIPPMLSLLSFKSNSLDPANPWNSDDKFAKWVPPDWKYPVFISTTLGGVAERGHTALRVSRHLAIGISSLPVCLVMYVFPSCHFPWNERFCSWLSR
jgi:hypothetical protein